MICEVFVHFIEKMLTFCDTWYITHLTKIQMRCCDSDNDPAVDLIPDVCSDYDSYRPCPV